MKKALLAVLAFAVPSIAGAQPVGSENYTLAATLGQAQRVDLGRLIHNEQTCNAAGLVLTCNEAQVQAVAGFESARIYVDTEAGREEVVRDLAAVPWFQEILNNQLRWDKSKAQINWCASSQTDKDAVCTSTALGLPAGCELYSCP